MFSPIVKMVTVRCVITIAFSNGWCLYQIDAYNKFLQGDLDEEVHMKLLKFSTKGTKQSL